MGRCLVIVAVIGLFTSSTNAMTMEECRAQYKAEYNHPAKKKGIGIDWHGYQTKRCGIDPNASVPAPKDAPKPH
ncbi:hypothetical protein ACVIHH_001380 [Bradyrhizobium sp. USDA 4518]|uniref:Uncharacterized protein n=1 Tax=Bradyrhizobium brasilense TaxID=1419277 RepID=A0ABY8JAY3_9BRAD|nr:hypothetical protein [Bradyrhizobium brasilense]WFU61143.1 hypothetical protein QA636_26865 [Bradyrhizobium brasilense]